MSGSLLYVLLIIKRILVYQKCITWLKLPTVSYTICKVLGIIQTRKNWTILWVDNVSDAIFCFEWTITNTFSSKKRSFSTGTNKTILQVCRIAFMFLQYTMSHFLHFHTCLHIFSSILLSSQLPLHFCLSAHLFLLTAPSYRRTKMYVFVCTSILLLT